MDQTADTTRMQSLYDDSVEDRGGSSDTSKQPPIGTPSTSIQRWRSLLYGMLFPGNRTEPVTADTYDGAIRIFIPIERLHCSPSSVVPSMLSVAGQYLPGGKCTFSPERADEQLSEHTTQDFETDARKFNHWLQCDDPDLLFRKRCLAGGTGSTAKDTAQKPTRRHTCSFSDKGKNGKEAMFTFRNRRVARSSGQLTSQGMPTLNFFGPREVMYKLRDYASSSHFAKKWGLEVERPADSSDGNKLPHALGLPTMPQRWRCASDATFGSGDRLPLVSVIHGATGRVSRRLVVPQSYLQSRGLSGDALLRVSLHAAEDVAFSGSEAAALDSLEGTLNDWEQGHTQPSFARTDVRFMNLGDSMSEGQPVLHKYGKSGTRSLWWTPRSFLIQSVPRLGEEWFFGPVTSLEVTFEESQSIQQLKAYVQEQAESQLNIRSTHDRSTRKPDLPAKPPASKSQPSIFKEADFPALS